MLNPPDRQEIDAMIVKRLALYDLNKVEVKLLSKEMEYMKDLKAMKDHLNKLGDHPSGAIVKADLAIRTDALRDVVKQITKVHDAIFKIEEHVT